MDHDEAAAKAEERAKERERFLEQMQSVETWLIAIIRCAIVHENGDPPGHSHRMIDKARDKMADVLLAAAYAEEDIRDELSKD